MYLHLAFVEIEVAVDVEDLVDVEMVEDSEEAEVEGVDVDVISDVDHQKE